MQMIGKSLQLNYKFLFNTDIPLINKIELLIKFYFIAFLTKALGVKLKPRISLFGSLYNYEDVINLGFLRSHIVTLSKMKSLLRKNNVIVDIGANIGQTNFIGYKFLNSKKVYSFEPVESAYLLAKSNSPKPDYVYNFAISTKEQFSIYAQHSLSGSMFNTFEKNTASVTKVKGKKLDQFEKLAKENRIDLVKIDVQGAEIDVINSSYNIINKTEFLLVELDLEGMFEDNLYKLMQKIHREFSPFKILRIHSNKNRTTAIDILFKHK